MKKRQFKKLAKKLGIKNLLIIKPKLRQGFITFIKQSNKRIGDMIKQGMNNNL